MLVAALAVMAVAAGLRGLHLQTVPQITDESAEVTYAWGIAFEGARPLTHTDSYDGPLWPYLMAAALRTAGPSLELPRRVAMALSLAAVAATFALGAMVARPGARVLTATVAGLVMATSFTQALVGGRVAWSNSSTPLWTTLAALALLKATTGQRRRWWLAAGSAAGLALQSHPSVIAFLVGLAVWFLLDRERRRTMTGPGPYLAVLAAVAAYAPVIVYNLRTGFDTLDQARGSGNLVHDPGAWGWVAGVGAAMMQFGRAVVGGFDVAGAPAGAGVALAAVVALVFGVLVAGGASPRGRGEEPVGRRLPLVVTAVVLAILPLVNSEWHGFLETRYLGMLIPLLGVATGVVAAEALAAVPRRRGVLALAIGVAVALPGARAILWVEGALDAGRDNRLLLDMAAVAADGSHQGRPVLVDSGLKSVPWPGRGSPRRAITYYLTLAEVPFEVSPVDEIRYHVARQDGVVAFTTAEAARQLRGSGPIAGVVVSAPGGYPAWGAFSTSPQEPRRIP